MTDEKTSTNGDFLERLVRGRYTGTGSGAAADEEAARADANSALQAIAKDAPPEGDSGGTRILIGDVHIQLGETAEELVVSLAELLFSSADPTQISKFDAFRRLGAFLWNIHKLVQKLDLDDLEVCRAVAAITARKKQKVLVEPGASENEIRADFEERDEMVTPKLSERLTDLTSRKVLESKLYGSSGPFYQVVF
jgi:hypothetical protein